MVMPLELLELEAVLQEEEAHQEAVLLARKYFAGDQTVYLTARAMEFLGIHDNNTFRANICRTVVTALAGEVNLIGFSTPETGEKKAVAEWAAEVYRRNKLDSLQDTVHEDALAESETFILVEWDPIDKYPRFIHHSRFVDTDYEGDGDGIRMVYENDDPSQRPIAAIKQWIETEYIGTAPHSITRRTIYYPDHLERWVFDGTWKHYEEQVLTPDGETMTRDWWIEQRDASGKPLGIPVLHFRNKGLRPEHWDAIPLQDAANKQLVDALAAGDLTAFQSFFGFGFYPTTDGKEPNADGTNVMKMGPGQFNGTTKPADQASLQVIPGADVTPIFNGLKDIILLTAQITETPASKFVTTAQVASEKTLKEQDKQLKKKAEDRRGLWGDAWVGCMNMARKLANLYGSANLSEDVPFAPVWEHTETLEELAEKKTALGIPTEQLWREAGYSEEQIGKMRQDPSYRVEFERALWEGAASATLNIPLKVYLKRAGVPEDEIQEIIQAIENQEGIPPTDL